MNRVKALLAIVVLLAFPAVAQAGTTLVLPDGTERPQPYQRWVDASRIPTPDMYLVLRLEPCPGYSAGSTDGCVGRWADGWRVYLTPPRGYARSTLLHELGHAFDRTTPNLRRGAFRYLTGARGTWHREGGHGGAPEWFADAYAMCARSARYPPSASSSPYAPDTRTHRRVCGLIRTASR